MQNNLSQTKQKRTIEILLGIGSIMCIALLSFRVYFTSSFHYAFLVWNLILAWIPVLLSNKLLKMDDQQNSILIIGGIFFAWLVFFPNSPYILTDLFHFKQKPNVPLWFDLILIISFAWNGLMLGFISLLKIQIFLNRKFKRTTTWSIIITILFLCGFGIYLGRFERYNSWDILTNPLALFLDIADRFIHPLSHPITMGVTLSFSTFLIISYLILFFLIKTNSNEE